MPNSSGTKAKTLLVEQTQLPITGTRKAKVLYDYDAHDSSELSLLADEVRLSIIAYISGNVELNSPLFHFQWFVALKFRNGTLALRTFFFFAIIQTRKIETK